MKNNQPFIRQLLAQYTYSLRKDYKLNQEQMAEQLRITSRAYGDLERGKFSCSATTLLFLLCMMPPQEVNRLLADFRRRVSEYERQESDELSARERQKTALL